MTLGSSDQTASVIGDLVFATTVEAGQAITVGRARADGAERWSTVLAEGAEDVDSVGAVDGVAFIEVCSADCSVFALGVDGTQLWSARVMADEAIVKNSRLYFLREDAIDLIDPRSGDVVRSVAGDFVTLEMARPATIVDVADGQEATSYDFDLQPVFGPELFGADELVYGDFDGAVVVVADDDKLEYWSDRRDVIRDVAIDPDMDIVEVLVVEPDFVVVETAAESIHGLDTSGDVAVELWRRLGSVRLSDVINTDAGPVVVGELGGSGVEVIDARTGDVFVSVSDGLGGAAVTFGRNALGISYYDFDAVTSEVSITDWSTGQELMRQTFDGLVDVVDGGGVISVAPDEIVYYD